MNSTKKHLIVTVALLFLVSSTSVVAFDVSQALDAINRIQRVADSDDRYAAAVEIGNMAWGLFCGCATTNSCEGIGAFFCADLTDPALIDSEGLRWASRILGNPEQGICALVNQNKAYNVGLSVDNTGMNSSFQRHVNAYVEAARAYNEDTMEYTYYYSFNFFPTSAYNSTDVKFYVMQGSSRIDLPTEVIPVTDQGFRHRYTTNSKQLYDKACMRFTKGNPDGFARNTLCARVTAI
ncbi:MAG: hypothetical protein ACMXYL_01365 [Candidatus Woesearchaeota archaeon]